MIDVMTAERGTKGEKPMTTFTIDTDNNITAFAARDQAEAVIASGAQPFATSDELTQLAAAWPTGRLVELWNSFAGVAGFGADLKPVKKFENRDKAAARIWKALQRLNGGAMAEAATAAETANAAPTGAKGERGKGKSSEKTTHAKKAPKAPRTKTPKPAKRESGAPREGTKTAQVVAMLQRKNGATLSEIMEKMGWQAHSVRGFISGTMKGAGYEVESFKAEGGERTYRITSK